MIQFLALLGVGITTIIITGLVFCGMALLYDDFQKMKKNTKALEEEIIRLRDEMQQDNGWMYK